MDEGQIRELVQFAVGTATLGAVRMTDGGQSETWKVMLPDRMVMVRLNPDHSQFADTRHNLEILSGLGLPVPSVLASGLTHADSSLAYLILNAIPGRDLRHEHTSMTEWQMTHLPPNLPSRSYMVVFHNCTKMLVKDVHLQKHLRFIWCLPGAMT